MELNRVPSKCCCPWVNEWQFPSVVVAAVEPCELCDHVQMQGNGGSSKWIFRRKDSSQISTTPLTAESTDHWALLCDRCSLLLKRAICNFSCRWVVFTGNVSSDIHHTTQPRLHTHTHTRVFVPLFRTVIALESVTFTPVQMRRVMQAHLSRNFQLLQKFEKQVDANS